MKRGPRELFRAPSASADSTGHDPRSSSIAKHRTLVARRTDDSKQTPQTLTAGTNTVRAALETPSACDITLAKLPDSHFDRQVCSSGLAFLHKVFIRLSTLRWAADWLEAPEYTLHVSASIDIILIHNGGFWFDGNGGGIWVSRICQ